MPQNQSAAYVDATQWLYDRIDYERLGKSSVNYRFTLDRMRELITRLGHGRSLAERPNAIGAEPGNRPRVIHIAGTKGKGSTATMAAAMLTAAGFRTGLYTSPHLVRLEERFRVDGVTASESEMVDLIESVKPIVDVMAREPIGGPSFFELTTAIAIEHFHRCRCDHWVLETGLGGRLDSTNVFQSDVTVITSIGLDHQHVLGGTVDKIAKEKAGIFKPGIPAINGVTEPLARDVIRHHAANVGAPMKEIDRDFAIQESDSADWGSQFQLTNCLPNQDVSHDDPVIADESSIASTKICVGLEGRHQSRNAALAIEAIRSLGVPVTETMLSELATLRIDARLERFDLANGVTVVLDAAHNPDSIAALVDTVKRRFGGQRVAGVFGTSIDKDAPAMLRQLKTCFDSVVLTRYHRNPRFVPTSELADSCRTLPTEPDPRSAMSWFSVIEDPLEACRSAIVQAASSADLPGVVVVCGSFFLAAEVRPWLMTQVS